MAASSHPPPRTRTRQPPAICTLAGPTRHYLSFDAASLALGKLGWLVFSVGSHRADDTGLRTTEAERRIYYRTHRAKITLSSMVYVVDLPTPQSPPDDARIGDDTMAELDYALERRVPVVRMSATWPLLGPSLVPVPPCRIGAPLDRGASYMSDRQRPSRHLAATAAGATSLPPDEVHAARRDAEVARLAEAALCDRNRRRATAADVVAANFPRTGVGCIP